MSHGRGWEQAGMGWIVSIALIAVGACGPQRGLADGGTDASGRPMTSGASVSSGGTTSGSGGAASADASTDATTAGEVGDDLCEFPWLPQLTCSPMAQNCALGERCTDVSYPGYLAFECVEEAPGARGLGLSCVPNPLIEPGSTDSNGISDDCKKGLECVGQDSSAACYSLCSGDRLSPDCADPAFGCWFEHDGIGGGACFGGTCRMRCSPILQNCGEGESCDNVFGEFLCVPNSQSEVGSLERCIAGQCGDEHVCVETTLQPFPADCFECNEDPCICQLCYKICEIGGADCESGTCTPYNPENDPALAEFGICRLSGEAM